MFTREKLLKIIYAKTHRDFKGKIDGVKTILINRAGATCLVPLDGLTDAEVKRLLPTDVRAAAFPE